MKASATTPLPDFFSPRRQFLRVLAADWRAVHWDILLGLFYVFIGFFFHRADAHSRNDFLIAPFLLSAIPMVLLTLMLCEPEANKTTRAFYRNLPRSRRITWWAHLALLCATALFLDAAIILLALLRLNVGQDYSTYTLSPSMLLVPFMALAVAYWLTYTTYAYALILLAVYIIFIWMFLEISDNSWVAFPATISVIFIMMWICFYEWIYPMEDTAS